MFKRARFVIAVNRCIARTGINPATINGDYRRNLIESALADGLSPEEAAAFLIYQLPMGARPFEAERVIMSWVSEGKVRRAVITDAMLAARGPISEIDL